MADMTNGMRTCLLVCLALFVVGCSGVDIDVEWDRKADFAAYRTWAWKPKSEMPSMAARFADGSPIADAIREEVGKLMADRGLERVSWADADLHVSWEIVITRTLKTYSVIRDASGSSRADPGKSFGAAGGSSNRKTVVREVQEGEFAINVHARASDELVWSGSATSRIDPETPINESVVQVRELVPIIMKSFPPK